MKNPVEELGHIRSRTSRQQVGHRLAAHQLHIGPLLAGLGEFGQVRDLHRRRHREHLMHGVARRLPAARSRVVPLQLAHRLRPRIQREVTGQKLLFPSIHRLLSC